MRPLKLSAGLVTLVLLVTGCATKTEYIEVTPDCTIPPDPVLPVVKWDDLTLPFQYLPEPEYTLYDNALLALEQYEASLGNSFFEFRAIVHELCD